VPMSSPEMNSPQISEYLTSLLGHGAAAITVNVASNGGTIIQHSDFTQHLTSLKAYSPQMSTTIQEGLKYPEIKKNLISLAQNLDELRTTPPEARHDKIFRINSALDAIMKASAIAKEVKPYATSLYALVKGYAKAHGVDLP